MKVFCRMCLILNLSLFFWTASACLLAAEEPINVNSAQGIEHLYILTFDQWGVLTNPAELEYAIQQLSRDASVKRIIIFSYGWTHDGRRSYSTYRKLVNQMSDS